MELTASRLLAHFYRLAEAPDAVARLRRFVLDLAVRGRLVEQDPAEGSTRKMVRKTEDFVVDEISGSARFSIPESWMWVTLGEAALIEMGQSPLSEHYNQSGDGLPFFQGKTEFGLRHPTPRYWCNQPTKIAEKGDILISVRAPVGPTNIAVERCCIGRGLAALRPKSGIALEYLLLCLRAFKSELAAMGFGTTFVAINKRQLTTFRIPLPRLGEQNRVVARVAGLMALCDRLETARAERETRRDRLVATSLHNLDHGAEIFREHARFHLDNLPRLVTQTEHIGQLRKVILNAAVEGKVVPQHLDDEPASKLLERVGSEVETYAKDRGAALPEPNAASAPLGQATPPNWRWVKLHSLFRVITDGDHQPPPKSDAGTAFLTIGNVTTGKLNFDHCRLVPNEYYKALPEYKKPRLGDILYTVVGATYGRPAFVDTRRDFCVQRHIAILKPASEMNVEFLCYLLASPLVYSQATTSITGSAQPTVALKPLRNFSVPLPPLLEQGRIVAKLKELMALCDRLETQFATSQTVSRRLLEAVLHEELAPAEIAD